jgi:VanZ family protein
VQKIRSFAIYWLPVVVWMAVIFGASSDSASFQHTSQTIGPLLRWLFNNLPNDVVFIVIIIVRKCAHLTEYAIFALLVWRALRKPIRGVSRPWLWSQFGEAMWASVFYAATDEFHQTFVPSREGCLRDVIIDTTGAAMGLLALWAFGRWRKYW